jgi:hypothetical protein
MWEGCDSRWARMAAAMSSQPPATDMPNWRAFGWRKKEMTSGETALRASPPRSRMMTCPTTIGLTSPSSDFGTVTPRPALRRLTTISGTRPAAKRLRTSVRASEVGSLSWNHTRRDLLVEPERPPVDAQLSERACFTTVAQSRTMGGGSGPMWVWRGRRSLGT